MCSRFVTYAYTIDVKRFAGLNIRSFSPVKFFMEILLQCIAATSVHYLLIAKNCKKTRTFMVRMLAMWDWYGYYYIVILAWSPSG